MIVMLFIVTGIFAIGMHLDILQALYFLISLITTVYVFKVALEYNYLDGNNNNLDKPINRLFYYYNKKDFPMIRAFVRPSLNLLLSNYIV